VEVILSTLGSDTFYTQINILSVGIFENNIVGLRIFPNPAHSQLNIEFSIDEVQNIVIELYNQIGQIIWRDNLNKFNGHYAKSLAIEHLNSGVYLLRITNETSISTNKVIIQ